jgi:hypothetical protein
LCTVFTSRFRGNVRSCRRQGLPDCHSAGTSVRRCMPHGIRNPDREADCRSRRRGRAAEPGQDDPGAAGVLDLDPGPETGTGPQGHPAGLTPRQAAMPGYAAADPARRGPGRQGAGGCGGPERPSPCFGITLSDEGGPGERARTRPAPIMASLCVNGASFPPRECAPGDRFHAGWPVCCRWRRVRRCGCGGLPGRPMPVGGRAGPLWRKFRRASSSRDRRLV